MAHTYNGNWDNNDHYDDQDDKQERENQTDPEGASLQERTSLVDLSITRLQRKRERVKISTAYMLHNLDQISPRSYLLVYHERRSLGASIFLQVGVYSASFFLNMAHCFDINGQQLFNSTSATGTMTTPYQQLYS